MVGKVALKPIFRKKRLYYMFCGDMEVDGFLRDLCFDHYYFNYRIRDRDASENAICANIVGDTCITKSHDKNDTHSLRVERNWGSYG